MGSLVESNYNCLSQPRILYLDSSLSKIDMMKRRSKLKVCCRVGKVGTGSAGQDENLGIPKLPVYALGNVIAPSSKLLHHYGIVVFGN